MQSKLTSKTWSTFLGFGKRAGDNTPTHVKPATTRQHPYNVPTHNRAINTTGKDINASPTRIDTEHTQKHLTLRSIKKTKQFVAFGLLLLAGALTVPVSAQVGPPPDEPVNICSRTDRVRDAILAAIPANPACAAVTATQLAAIGTLDVSLSDIRNLKSGDFAGLSVLTSLDLSGNLLTTLPADIFDDLTSLDILDLTDNNLTALPPGVFDDLISLTSLDLNDNDLTALPANVFDNLTNLTSLNLNSNDLTTLPANVFDNLTNLTSLTLTDNELDALNADVFSTLVNLETLTLNDNMLSALPDGLFSGLTRLTTLWLHRRNTFTTALPADIFDDLPSTAVIRIDLSPIGDLTGVALTVGGMPTINVANAFISRDSSGADRTITYTATPANTAVATVSLSGGGVATITGAGMGTTTVSVLANDGVSGTVGMLTRDIAVTVVGTGILAFDAATGNTIATPIVAENGGTDMLHVQLASAPVSDVTLSVMSSDTAEGTVTPSELTFTTMNWNARQALTVTAVNDNVDRDDSFTVDFAITTGDGGAYQTLTLPSETVTITDDDVAASICTRTDEVQTVILARIPGSPACADVIESQLAAITGILFLNNMVGLTTLLPGDLAGLSGVTALFLDGNSLSTLPSGIFSDLGRVTVLDLSSNALTALPAGVFDGLTSLNTFDLSSNALTALPAGVFTGLTSLSNLDLSSNALTALPAGLFNGLSALTQLNLSSNALTTLPANAFSGLTSLTGLVLSGNALITINTNAFSGLTSLTILRLTNNALTALSDGAFTGLGSLATLRLQGNTFTTRLPADIFNDLANFEATGRPRLQIDLSPIGDLDEVALTVGGTTTINVANAFISRDRAGNDRTLSYTLTPANTAVATVMESSGVVTITGAGMGTTTVSVLADDGESGAVGMLTRNIAVTVVEVGLAFFEEVDSATGSTEVTSITTGEPDVPATFYVELISAPTADVTVAVMSDDTTEGMITTGASLTFTTGNWNIRQPVTVTGQDDNLIDVDTSYNITLASTSSDANYNALTETLSATNTDDDVVVDICSRTTLVQTAILNAISPSPICSTVTESQLAAITSLDLSSDGITSLQTNDFTGLNGLATLNLASNFLATLPANIFDALTSLTTLNLSDNGLSALPAGVFNGLTSLNTLQLNGNMLTTLPANLFSDLTSLTSLRLQGNPITTPLPANLFDPLPDAAVIEIDLSPIGDLADIPSLTLGGVATINVANAFISRTSAGTDRALSYTITPTGTSVASATEDAGVLTITASDTITGVTTIDIVANDMSNTVTRNIAVTVDAPPATAGLAFFDAATAGNPITAPLTTTEAGGTATFYVELTSAPTADVTVTVTSDDTTEGMITTGGSLTFTATGGTAWNIRQQVIVTGQDDSDVDGDVDYDVILASTSSDTNYSGLTDSTVDVTNTDDDVAATAGLAFFDAATAGNPITAPLTTTEAGGTATFYVELTSAPTADVTVTVTSDDTTEGMITTGGSLTFTATGGTAWNIRQQVIVTGQDDSDVDGDVDYDVILASTSSDTNYSGLTDSTVDVTNTDDDVAATAGLAFFDAATAGNPITAPLTTTEAGGTATFYVELTSAPTADVTVTVTSDDTTEGMITTGGSLTFTATGGTAWNIRQQVIVTGQDDSDVDGDVDYDVILASTSSDTNYSGLTDSTVDVTNTDDDVAATAGLAFFDAATAGNPITAPLTTTEAGGTATFYVELTSAPTADVTVTVTSDDTTEGMITTGGSLTFTATGGTAWNIRQQVIVTGQDDSDVDGDVDYDVILASTSSDTNYSGLTDSTVDVTNTDDDVAATAGLAFFDAATAGNPITAPLTTTEAGGTATFYVELTSAPTADVTVTVTSDDTTEGMITTGGSLTFTATGGTAWNIRQQVIVTGQDDSDVDGDVDYDVILASTSSDTNYSGLTDSTVDVTNTDDDVAATAGLAFFDAATAGNPITAPLTTTEAGGTATFYVELTSAPTADVTVTVTSDDTTEGMITTGGSLTFTATGGTAWNIRQQVIVTGQDDSDVDGDVDYDVILASTSSDTNYSGLTDSTVDVTNTDDDVAATAGLAFFDAATAGNPITAPLTTTEAGGTATFYVELTSAPTADVTVTVTSDDTTEGMITTGGSLTFTATGGTAWNIRQQVIVTGQDDSDVDGDVDYDVILASTSSDTNYSGLTDSTVDVTNTDDEVDQQAIEQTVAAQASGITQVVTEQIGIRLVSRASTSSGSGGSTQDRQSLSAIDWQDDLAKFTYEGLKRLDSEADMSLDWLLRAAGGNGQLLMPLGVESLTLWATGGGISTKGDGVADYDGDVKSFILGIDTALSNDWLAGIAVSYNDSEIDYTMNGTAKTEQTLYGFHPYLSYTLSQGLTLWATGGYGFGDVDFSHTGAGQATSDVTQWMAAGGLEKQIITSTPWQGALRIKGLWGNAEVDATEYSGGIPIAKVDSDFWRARMESELGYNFPLSGANIRPYALIGARWDHSDATIVSGDEWHVDVGGGVELSDNAFALNISVRTQVTEGDTEEDSIFATGSLTYDLEQDGRGLQIALSRSLDNTSPAWDSHSFSPLTDTASGLSGAPLTSELAYGWTVHPFGLKGALQTYVQNSFDSDDRHYAVGLELAVNALTLSFESGYHTNLDSETRGSGLESMLKTKIRW